MDKSFSRIETKWRSLGFRHVWCWMTPRGIALLAVSVLPSCTMQNITILRACQAGLHVLFVTLLVHNSTVPTSKWLHDLFTPSTLNCFGMYCFETPKLGHVVPLPRFFALRALLHGRCTLHAGAPFYEEGGTVTSFPECFQTSEKNWIHAAWQIPWAQASPSELYKL